jgi:hypothetical protein
MTAKPRAAQPTGESKAHSPMPFLAGAWSTLYSSHLHREQMEIPNILPGKTLGIFFFNAVNKVRGELRPNVAGRVTSVISFDGTYTLFRDQAFGLLEGLIDFPLPSPSGGKPSKNRIFFLVRTADELDWVLLGSDDPARRVVAGGKLFRIQPIFYDPPVRPRDFGLDLSEPGELKS